jgi:hypothetical protein
VGKVVPGEVVDAAPDDVVIDVRVVEERPERRDPPGPR